MFGLVTSLWLFLKIYDIFDAIGHSHRACFPEFIDFGAGSLGLMKALENLQTAIPN